MRYWFIALLFICSTSSWAQRQGKPPNRDPFLSTQWYLGFFGGGNLSKATPSESYNGYAPLNYNVANIQKEYDNFPKLEGQYGLVFMFYTKGFTIASKPGFFNYSISHGTSANWVSTIDPNNTLEVKYNHETTFEYLEFPLTVQYDLLKDVVRPYVGIGGYYGMRLNATRTVQRSGIDGASGSAGGFENQAETIGIKELFITSAVGIQGFLGVSYDPGNIRIALDIGYKHGLFNITDANNRYLNNELSALGEAMDDISLQNMYFTLGAVFPLKFISSSFEAIN